MPLIHQLTSTSLYLGVFAPIMTVLSARLIVYLQLHSTAAATMFEQVIQRLADLISSQPWVSEVAAILPLSALIDFVDVPQKLHIHQLVAAVPHWSWPVTPAGSRLLLEDAPTQQECALDRFGRSTVLEGMDGCFGARYYVMNPETVRLIIESLPPSAVENRHDNMKMEKSALRIQNLQVLFVSRNPPPPSSSHRADGFRSRLRWLRFFSSWQSTHSSLSYQLTSLLGWAALLGCLAAAIMLKLHIATAFLVLMPATGLCITALYPGSPRKLLKAPWPGEPMRMVVVAEHFNSADWIAFYGPGTAINSLLNTPLEPSASTVTTTSPFLLRALLRFLVISQWALAVAAAATKDWNSFFLSFWVLFCNVTHGYVIPPSKQAGAWAKAPGCANLNIRKVEVKVSTRRALLSTLVALNPDSFREKKEKERGKEKSKVTVTATATATEVVPGSGSTSGSTLLDSWESGSGSGSVSGPESSGNKSAQTGDVQVQEVQQEQDDDVDKPVEFPSGSTRWIDPILPTGHSRTEWEKAMRKALLELAPNGWDGNTKDVANKNFEAVDRVLELEMEKNLRKVETEVIKVKRDGSPVVVVTKLPALSDRWNAEYVGVGKEQNYWNRFVSEGIYLAAKIREIGRVPEEEKKAGVGGKGVEV